MKTSFKFILFFSFVMSGCFMHNELEFFGKIISWETDGIIVEEDNKKFVSVNVRFLNLKNNKYISIDYHIMQTNPDIESVRIEENSLDWIFHEGNVLHVIARKLNNKYIEEIYSIQEL